MEPNQQDYVPAFDWQEQYEQAAGEEHNLYGMLPIAAILHRVERGQYGEYNRVWHVLAEQATLQQAGWTMFRVLQRAELDYLIRCNCAEALLELLGRTDVMRTLDEAVNLTSGSPAERAPYLAALQQELTNRLGEKPA